MYNCPTCGAPISMNAPICFNCGETAYANGGGGCGLMIAIIVVIILAMAIAH